VAGSANTTLTGGGSDVANKDIFTFRQDSTAAHTDVVTNFVHGVDFLHLGGYGIGTGAEHAAIQQYNSSGYFTLADGTKVVLDGVATLSQNDFK